MKIKCISLDFSNSDLANRLTLWRQTDKLREHINSGDISECLPIHTCNRTEIYIVTDDGGFPEELYVDNAKIYSGPSVVEHLLRVLLGLESMACGESFVVSQIKKDYSTYGELCGKILNHVVQKSLNLTSKLRNQYHPGRAPSIPWLMVQSMKEHPKWPDVDIMLLGAGEMGEETGSILKAMNVPFSISNRSEGRGREIARNTNGKWLNWNDWRNHLSDMDIVVIATSSNRPLFSDQDCNNKSWVIDMGSTPQCHIKDNRLITIDDLKEKTRELLSDYRRQLIQLEDKAGDSAQILWEEIISMKSDHYKKKIMNRIEKVIEQRAIQTSQKLDCPSENLIQMGQSIAKAILDPLWDIKGHDKIRTLRALAGEMQDES